MVDPIGPPADRLFDLASDVLDAVVTYYEAVGEALPSRRYVAAGPAVAWDCEQLTVHIDNTIGTDGNVTGGSAEPQFSAAGFGARAALVVIELVRCHPVQKNKSLTRPRDEQDSARRLYRDAQLQLNACMAGVRDERLTRLNDFVFQQWQGEGPEGGYVGSTLRAYVGTTALGLARG